MRHCCRVATFWLALLLLPAAALAGDGQLREIRGRSLLLQSGEILWLAGIEWADAAAGEAFLREKTEGAVLTWRGGKARDRHGRLPAQVDADGEWLQQALVEAGLARVYTFPADKRWTTQLMAAERKAEQARRGIWRQPVLSPESASGHIGEFALVQGQLRQVAESRGRYYLNFGEDWRTDFTVVIEGRAKRSFDLDALKALEGSTIRVRGWLFRMNGPALELTHPGQLERIAENQ